LHGETRCAASAASAHTATTAALRRRRRRRERGRGEKERCWARNQAHGRRKLRVGRRNRAACEEVVRRAVSGRRTGRPDAQARLEWRRRALLALGACAQSWARWAAAAAGRIGLGARPACWAGHLARARAGNWAGRGGPRGCRRVRARGREPSAALGWRGSWAERGWRAGLRRARAGASAGLGRALSWPTREGWRGWAEGEEREGKGGAGGLAEMGQGRGLG
jgi:hypothetical protein